MNYITKTLALSDITLDTDTQPRVKPNNQALEHFIDLLISESAKFPPVVIFQDGENNYLADGWHRYEAHRRAFKKAISCHIYQGTKRDAILYSVGANGTHGLNMTNADKRRAVTKLLEDPEWSKWGDREIARRCHVDHSFVGKMRKSLVSNHSEIPQDRTYTNKQGGTSVMNTANIGKRSIQVIGLADSPSVHQIGCSESCTQTIAKLNGLLAAAQEELKFKDQLITDLENQLTQLRTDESLPY